MTSFAGKRLEDLSLPDLEALVESETPESQELEFKETLPAAGREVDGWISGGESIGNRARDTIVQEIIGFANSYGGHLVLGIRESDDHPRRATELCPLPRAAELAERLSLQLRDCVEPELPQVELRAVPMLEDGQGIIVVWAPQSRLRPHRQVQNLHVPVRRRDRTEKMTMREIQDLVLLRDREGATVEALFEERSTRFDAAFRAYKPDSQHGICALRITALPTAPHAIDQAAVRRAAIEPVRMTYMGHDQSGPVELSVPFSGWTDRPILGGKRWVSNMGSIEVARELNYNGGFQSILWEAPREPAEIGLYLEWVAGEIINALLTVDRIRRGAGTPSLEYGIEVELRRRGGPVQLMPLRHRFPGQALLIAEGERILLPRFGFQERAQISSTVGVVLRDLYEATDWPFALEHWSVDIPEDV